MKSRILFGLSVPVVLVAIFVAISLPGPSAVKGCFNPNDYPRCKATSTPTPRGGGQQSQNHNEGCGNCGNSVAAATFTPTPVPDQVENLLAVALLVHRDKDLHSDVVGALQPGESADLVQSDMIHSGLVQIRMKNGTIGWIAGRNGDVPNVSIGES